jgi:hypothetical protein
VALCFKIRFVGLFGKGNDKTLEFILNSVHSQNAAIGICHADHVTPSVLKTSPTSGRCSIDIVFSQTKVMEFSFFLNVT